MITSGKQAEDLKPLTSLRFLAAMMIVLVHCLLYFKWSWLSVVPQTFVQGVSFFFVLSGFILTHAYVNRPVTYKQFIRARFARIWPLHIVTLVLVPLLVQAGSVTFDGPGLFSKWLTLAANFTLTQSLIPFTAYYFSWNSVSWSISTEAFFYLAFPLLLVNIERTWHWKLALSLVPIGIVVAVASALNLPSSGNVNELTASSLLYASPFVHSFEFCLGMATYVVWSRSGLDPYSRGFATLTEVAALSLALATVAQGYRIIHPITMAWPVVDQWLYQSGSSCVFALVIFVLASGRGWLGAVLTTQAAVWLGEISFAMYMVHMIVMKVIFLAYPEYGTAPIVIGTCIASAALLHHAIERPARAYLTGRSSLLRSLAPVDAGGSLWKPNEKDY